MNFTRQSWGKHEIRPKNSSWKWNWRVICIFCMNHDYICKAKLQKKSCDPKYKSTKIVMRLFRMQIGDNLSVVCSIQLGSALLSVQLQWKIKFATDKHLTIQFTCKNLISRTYNKLFCVFFLHVFTWLANGKTIERDTDHLWMPLKKKYEKCSTNERIKEPTGSIFFSKPSNYIRNWKQ